MAEKPFKAQLPADNARVVDDRDSLESAESTQKPKDELDALRAWVMNHVKQWRDHRRQNYELLWDEYERLWRGMWAPEDKSRKSEKSKMVTPALGEAVENIVAEVEEALFGRGDIFDMKGDAQDSAEMKEMTDRNKTFFKEDLARSDFTGHVGEALINAAVYGTGIAEIVIKNVKQREIANSVAAMMPGVAPEIQLQTKTVKLSFLQSVNPRNFLIDPTSRNIDDALGVAIEEYVGAHLIKAGQKEGLYRNVEVGTSAGDTELAPDRQNDNEYVFDKVHIVRYYGLVPSHLIFPKGATANLADEAAGDEGGDEEMVDRAELGLSEQPEQAEAVSGEQKSTEAVDADMIEALVVIANDGVVLKVAQNPYTMEDRPVVAFQWDVVPGRFWGRGVCEKGLVPQKVMDAELRARIDALAYVSAPMIGMDASRLPHGFQLTVKPGKSILVNGKPSDALFPLHFGQLEQSTFNHSQQLDQMVQRATGSLDVISLASKAGGDARPGAVSMMLSGIVKRHKRTLMGFIDKFYVPALRKMMWRNMQFYPERYTPYNWTFNASSTMGILQREYESQNLVSLMQTMDPQSKEYKILLMGVVGNTGLSHRTQIMKMIEQSITTAQAVEEGAAKQQLDPVAQQLAQTNMQLEIAEKRARIAELNARANLQTVKARNEEIEPQFRQADIALKGIYQVAQNQQKSEFDRRLKVMDQALQFEDIRSNERIARIQAGGNTRSEALRTAGTVASERIAAGAQKHANVTKLAGEVAKAQGGAETARAEGEATRRTEATKAAAQLANTFIGSQAKVVE